MGREKIPIQREHFKFDVADWKFDYGFHVNADAGARDLLGPCWEGHHLMIGGPLRSKTKRRNCASVQMTLHPADVVPSNWSIERKGFGQVQGVRRGVLVGIAFLPAQSFHSFLTVLAAGKVRRCYVGLRDVVRGAGVVDSFFTVDPDDDGDDE
jgi:hypothetical protein